MCSPGATGSNVRTARSYNDEPDTVVYLVALVTGAVVEDDDLGLGSKAERQGAVSGTGYTGKVLAEERGELGRADWHAGELLTGAARFGDGVSALDRHAAVGPVEVELGLVPADRRRDRARTRKRRQREIIREPVHETIIPDEVGLAANFSPASRVSAEASVQALLTRSGRSPEYRWQTVGVTEAGLPELDMARVRRWCQQRVPEHARSQVKVECDVAPRQLTIVECRPPWHQDMGAEWTRFPIARLRYTKATRQWSLYWRDRHLRFHLYDRMMPSPRIDDLLREIDRDPTGIFWG